MRKKLDGVPVVGPVQQGTGSHEETSPGSGYSRLARVFELHDMVE